MIIILFRMSRWTWSTLQSMITRRQQFRRNGQTATCPAESSRTRDQTSNEANIQDEATNTQNPSPHGASIEGRVIPRCSDTELIVSQLAGLATTVSRSSTRNLANSRRSSYSSVLRTVNMQSGGNSGEELEEENFHYLRSLITVSSLSPHASMQSRSPPASEEKGNQPMNRKRASSRLSLRLADLPKVSFMPKVSRKPCPRYTCLPPAWTPKSIAIRPEVRF
jgi:hypothetical protein